MMLIFLYGRFNCWLSLWKENGLGWNICVLLWKIQAAPSPRILCISFWIISVFIYELYSDRQISQVWRKQRIVCNAATDGVCCCRDGDTLGIFSVARRMDGGSHLVERGFFGSGGELLSLPSETFSRNNEWLSRTSYIWRPFQVTLCSDISGDVGVKRKKENAAQTDIKQNAERQGEGTKVQRRLWGCKLS